MQDGLDPSRLVFLDECSVNCGMTRLYARAKKSERVNDYTPDVRFERTSVISTISLDGRQAPLVFKGTLDGEVFAEYVREILAPTLRAGDIVILDNLTSHKVKRALEPIYRKGASAMFLPPYSPDLNPIEMAWSKMKSILRKLKARTFEDLEKAMAVKYNKRGLFVKENKAALASISASDLLGWFRHDGYIANV
jgi:transposase